MRCKGRLEKANIPLRSKFPVLIPKHGVITTFLIEECHKRLMHGGASHTLMELNINNNGKTNEKNDSANNGLADGGSVTNDNGAADRDQQLIQNDGGTVQGGTEVKARGKRQAAKRSMKQLRQLIVSDSD